MGAEMALREMGSPTLAEALDYLSLLAESDRRRHREPPLARLARDRGSAAHAGGVAPLLVRPYRPMCRRP